ncbi:MAG: hypothetical protein V4671_17165 [Armatimonadota bacterium]
MTDQNLPALRPTTCVSTGFPILVTVNVMKMISDPSTAVSCQPAIERAIQFTQQPPTENPRTTIFESCPLTVHADPARRIIIILSKFPGWPAVTEDFIEELLPFCSPMSFA